MEIDNSKNSTESTTEAGENTAFTRETPPTQESGNYKVGPGHPPKHTQFSSTRQPDHSKQKETKRRKKFTREILHELMNMRYEFDDASQVKKQLEKAFGKKLIDKANVMEVATFMQLQKAILKGDTNAFRELMVQAYGQPKQTTEVTGPGGTDPFHQKTDSELADLLKQTLSKLNGAS